MKYWSTVWNVFLLHSRLLLVSGRTREIFQIQVI